MLKRLLMLPVALLLCAPALVAQELDATLLEHLKVDKLPKYGVTFYKDKRSDDKTDIYFFPMVSTDERNGETKLYIRYAYAGRTLLDIQSMTVNAQGTEVTIGPEDISGGNMFDDESGLYKEGGAITVAIRKDGKDDWHKSAEALKALTTVKLAMINFHGAKGEEYTHALIPDETEAFKYLLQVYEDLGKQQTAAPVEDTGNWSQVIRFSGSKMGASDAFALNGKPARLRYELKKQDGGIFVMYVLPEGTPLPKGDDPKPDLEVAYSKSGILDLGAKPAGRYYLALVTDKMDYTLTVEQEGGATAAAAKPQSDDMPWIAVNRYSGTRIMDSDPIEVGTGNVRISYSAEKVAEDGMFAFYVVPVGSKAPSYDERKPDVMEMESTSGVMDISELPAGDYYVNVLTEGMQYKLNVEIQVGSARK